MYLNWQGALFSGGCTGQRGQPADQIFQDAARNGIGWGADTVHMLRAQGKLAGTEVSRYLRTWVETRKSGVPASMDPQCPTRANILVGVSWAEIHCQTGGVG